MTQEFPMMVPGARRAAGSIAVEAPYDGAQIATVEAADMSTVDTALATAQRLYQDRRGWLPTYQRVEILEKAQDIMVERAEELAV